MTTYPFPVIDQGLCLQGHVTPKSAARTQAAEWLVSERGVSEEDAADLVDGIRVANDAYYDEVSGGFVSPDYPYGHVVPVTMVCGLYTYLYPPGETPPSPEVAPE